MFLEKALVSPVYDSEHGQATAALYLLHVEPGFSTEERAGPNIFILPSTQDSAHVGQGRDGGDQFTAESGAPLHLKPSHLFFFFGILLLVLLTFFSRPFFTEE